MALAATVIWEVRTSGNDTNGGGFDPGVSVPGTDFSQQAAAQIAFTDLVIGNPTTTQLTSAGNPFGATHVGNLINITSGTNFTQGWYTILSVSGVTATVDRSVGTAGSTGGHGNLGGAFASPGRASSGSGPVVGGNLVYVKTGGTFSLSGSLGQVNGGLVMATGVSELVPSSVIGYSSSRTYLNTDIPPVWDMGVNNQVGIQMDSKCVIRNISMTNASAFTNCLGVSIASRTSCLIESVQVANCDTGISSSGCTGLHLYNCFASGNTFVGFQMSTGNIGCSMSYCVAINNSNSSNNQGGFRLGSFTVLNHCISAGNTGAGFNMSTDAAKDCVFYQCTASGNTGTSGAGFLDAGGRSQYINCIAWTSDSSIVGGVGLFRDNVDTTPNYLMRLINCAGNSVTSASISPTVNNIGFFSLSTSVSPFTNVGGTDFSLNGVAGGGILLRNSGTIQRYSNIPTSSYFDVGAAQHNA